MSCLACIGQPLWDLCDGQVIIDANKYLYLKYANYVYLLPCMRMRSRCKVIGLGVTL